MLIVRTRLFTLIITVLSVILLLSTFVYLKSLRELNSIQTWVKAEIRTSLQEKNASLSEEEQAHIDWDAKETLKRRRFLSIKFDQELKLLSLKQLDIEYLAAHNHCAHLEVYSNPHQSCVAQILQDLKENRRQFEDLLMGDRG